MKKILKLIFILLLALSMQGCAAGLHLIDVVEDFDGVIGGITDVSPKPPPDDNPDDNPSDNPDDETGGNDKPVSIVIKGFEQIFDVGYDTPASFGTNNSYAVIKDGERTLLMDKNGKVIQAPDDVKSLVFDKYIYQDASGSGLKEVLGNVIIESSDYLRFDIEGNTVLAFTQNSAFLFKEGKLLRAFSLSDYKSMALYNDERLIIDGNLYDLKLNPYLLEGYAVISYDSEFAVLKNERNTLGYYDFSKRGIIGSFDYVSATAFQNGFAVVQKEYDGRYFVIDGNGKEVATFENRPCGFYDNYMFVSDRLNGLALYDNNFTDTGLRFREVYKSRVFDGYIIDTTDNRIFSLDKRAYLTESYKQVNIFDYGFICFDGKDSKILDFNLKQIGEFDDASFDSGILSVKKEGKYYYFKRK